MPTVNSFWIGNKLGSVHAACLRSFVRTGHDVVLHAYGRPEDTPDGVRLFDANKLMRETEIISHKKTGSLALASDIYRYRIMREGLGIYIDADMYSVKPLVDDEYLFGFETYDRLNGAVLKIPQKSKLLAYILNAAEDPYFIPPWMEFHKRAIGIMRKAIGFPRHISTRTWGAIGPTLITHCVRENGLLSKAKPVDIYYPLDCSQTDRLFERGLRVEDIATDKTQAIHLFNTMIKNREILPDTPLHQIISA
jgi:hypothetical protein